MTFPAPSGSASAEPPLDPLLSPSLAPSRGRDLSDPDARELVAALREADRQNTPFDRAVRRWVRRQRASGADLDAVLAKLQRTLADHVEPLQRANRRGRLRTGVLWFAVSEWHRAD